MFKNGVLISCLLFHFVLKAQEVSLPADLRQHTLTQYNASLFNPTFSINRNNPESVSFWTRWQWQNIDPDPTTLYLNYSKRLNEKSAVGAAFFQHNTGIYFNTGGVVNYAYEIRLNPLIKFAFGANLFAFNQQLADTRFLPDPDILPGAPQVTDDFIMQLAPGFSLSVENFTLSMASENLADYNFTDKEANTDASDKIFMGMASYDFPIASADSTAFIRPSIYLRTIPEEVNQIGLNALFSTQKYWIQSGYNNFYGISVGAGGTVFNRVSVGALVEFGTNASINSKDASFELIASYFLGKPGRRRQPVVRYFKSEDEEVVILTDEERERRVQEALEKSKTLTTDAKIGEKLEGDENNTSDDISEEVILDSLKETKEAKRRAREEKAEEKRRLEASAKARQEAENEARKLREEEVRANQLKERQAKEAARIQAEKLEQTKKLEEKRMRDSIANAQKNVPTIVPEKEAVVETTTRPEVVTVQQGEKYEEVQNEDGLAPGYYLIANVFGTKKYFDAFMRDLRNKGIEGGSFFRSKNNFNYAYLDRYATISEARRARDSKFGGSYSGKTWIFRVVGK